MVIKTLLGEVRQSDVGYLSLFDIYAIGGGEDAMKSPSVWLRDRGFDGVTDFASQEVALAYAMHLKKSLFAQLQSYLGGAVEMAEFKANKDANLRASARGARKVFCDALVSVGLDADEVVKQMTRKLYEGVLGAPIGQLYKEYGAKKSLRDALPSTQLIAVMMAENNASVRLLSIDHAVTPGMVEKVVYESARVVATMLDYQRSKRID